MTIEDTLEKGYKALFEALSYITTNSITVEQNEDNSIEINPPLVSVHCSTLSRMSPNAPFYMSECNFTCMSYKPDDKDRAVLKAIYNELFNYISDLTPIVLATETSLNIDGLVMDESGDEDQNDNYQTLSVKIKTYLTK